MLDKLKNISKRYDAINEKLSDPAIFSDKQEFAALMRERKGLEPVVEKNTANTRPRSRRNGRGERVAVFPPRRGTERNGGSTVRRSERSENET